MKLEINLADREEIAAAVPLLQMILDNTPASAGERMTEATAAGLAPLALSAAAHSTAAAAPSSTAPEVAPVSSTVPPAPPAPAAPTVSAAPVPPVAAAPTSPAPAVDLDSKGLPWDERIHASTKSKISNGTWKLKRGVEDSVVAAVEAELRARMAAAPAAPAVPPPPAAPEAPTMTPAQAFGGAAAPAPLPGTVPPVAPSVPAPPAAPSVAADPTTFDTLMPRLSAATVAGTLPPNAVNEACVGLGLTSVVALQTAPQFVPHVWAALKQKYPALV